MSDTIYRQAAIDAVIKADYEDSGVLSERRCRKFETALKALPPAQQWIPCSVKLPEMHDAGILKKMGIQKRSKYVFITIASEDEKIVDADAELRDGKWHSDTLRWISAGGRKVEVTAWMPYPEPYREKNNESI